MFLFLLAFLPQKGTNRKCVKKRHEEHRRERESCGIYIKLYSDMECADLSLAPLTNRTPTEVNGLGAKHRI